MKKIFNSIKRRPLSYTSRKSLYGYCFIAIWIIGFITFFVRPFVTSVIYSLSDIQFVNDGMTLTFNNFSAYKKIILEDPDLLRELLGCFTELIYSVPVIVVVSIMIAVMLNDNFAGKTFFRAVFFLPVIISGGAILGIIRGDDMMSLMVEGSKSGGMLEISNVQTLIAEFDLPEKLSTFLITISNTVFDLLWKSGIQILLFLAAIQTISPSIYEASKIEGASGWDNFWKITVPMISPMILLAVIYSIIDSFTASDNAVMKTILSESSYLRYTNASVLSVLYFASTMLFIGIIYFVLNRVLPYSGSRR